MAGLLKGCSIWKASLNPDVVGSDSIPLCLFQWNEFDFPVSVICTWCDKPAGSIVSSVLKRMIRHFGKQ